GRSAEGLGEEADPQFLDHPADRHDLRVGAAGRGEAVEQVVVVVLDLVDAVHPLLVAPRVFRQFGEAAVDGAEVAQQVGQAGVAGGGDEAGVDEPAELVADVVGGGAGAQGVELGAGGVPDGEDLFDAVQDVGGRVV